MTTPATIGDRVRLLRLASGLSQSELARAVSGGVSDSNGLVSKIENGRLPIDAATLRSLASALGCAPDFLESEPPGLIGTRPWLRAYADASSRVVDSVVSDNLLVAEAIDLLRLRRIPDQIPVFDGDPNDDDAIERYAEEVRTAAKVREGAVVGNAIRAAERLGCVVLPLSGELGRHLGMSQRINGASFIRVSRPGSGGTGVPGDRQRFTVLHEVGHLALHAATPPPETADEARRIERQAHRFASAFLTPVEPLLDHWSQLGGRVTLSVLAELKATWGIAIKALVVRFQQIGVIESDQATSLYKQISKRGWNKAEPVSMTNEEPVWLSRALAERTGSRHALPGLVGRLTRLSESHVDRWLDWSPVGRDAEVVSLPKREASPPSGNNGIGQIVPFIPPRR